VRARETGGGEPFAIRGVIEGFYGRPWSHEQRLELIAFIGDRGMNRYVYAPKDDPYLRRAWDRPYSGTALARLGELVAAGASGGAELMYCLSPGLSIRYSSATDQDMLVDRLLGVAGLGVRHFAVLLDDIPTRLQHPEDIAAFETLAQAHGSLVSDVHARLTAELPESTLTVCPTAYWGYGNEPYLAELGSLLPVSIDLFWTGRAICSATLDTADADVFHATTGRRPLYWDNYPVNDVAMGHELHVGPYRGRAADLAEHSRGVVANAMELFESSKIPIATIADYLRSPSDYDAEESWAAAVASVAGPDAEAYSRFADNVRSSCLCADDAPAVTQALEDLAFATITGRPDAALRTLAPLTVTLRAAADSLLDPAKAGRPLLAEARPWLESFELGVQALEKLCRLIEAGRLEQDGPAELTAILAEFRRRGRRVFGDVLDMTLTEICYPITENY
jgi:hyaluronoglucosaminidase